MKTTFSILLVFLSGISLAQTNILAGTSWKCGSHIFEDKTQEIYSFTAPAEADDWSYHWGYSIGFGDDGTFSTNYSAPCGNDCFTRVSGTYSFIDENVVVIYVETISRNGFCTLESETPKAILGKFKVNLTEDGEKMTFTMLN